MHGSLSCCKSNKKTVNELKAGVMFFKSQRRIGYHYLRRENQVNAQHVLHRKYKDYVYRKMLVQEYLKK